VFGLVGLYSYGLYLIHQPYVIWLGLRIREQPIWMFLLIRGSQPWPCSACGNAFGESNNTLVNKLRLRKKNGPPLDFKAECRLILARQMQLRFDFPYEFVRSSAQLDRHHFLLRLWFSKSAN